MATTRGRHSLLQRSVPERKRTHVLDTLTTTSSGVSSLSPSISVDSDNILRDLDTVDMTELGDLAVISGRPPLDCTERFSPRFVDPLFPIHPVKFATGKRAFDIVFAGTFLLLAWPILLFLAIAVKLTSRGPVLFKQIRVGRGGRYFHCYKFRSMCVDAEAKKAQLMHLNEASGPVFKIKQDPRITPIGQMMRKFSFDELPQFVNVLKGEMSVVGPRPPITSEVEMYSDHDRRRLSVQPGLTCLWQVSGRSNLSFEKWVELDLCYIDSMSFANDVKIILKTIPAVVTGSGAH